MSVAVHQTLQTPGTLALPLNQKRRLRAALARPRERSHSRANQAFSDWGAFRL
jgi:hypothetical protein